MTDKPYTDYSNDELRRAVAERLGWTDLEWYEYLPPNKPWLIGNPPDADGQSVGIDGKSPTPQWPESLDACWRDLRSGSLEVKFEEWIEGDVSVVFLRPEDDIFRDPPQSQGESDNPARAWVVAWLRLQDALAETTDA